MLQILTFVLSACLLDMHAASHKHTINPLQASIPVLQIFMLFLVHAYSTLVWKQQEADNSSISAAAIEHGFQSPEGHSKLIMDGPWILLWPCLLLWPWFQAVIGFGWIHNAIRKPSLLVARQLPALGTCAE